MAKEIIRLSDVSKTFPGVKALQNINFVLQAGTVHCICGENGAGKSTLIKILSGAYQPDEGGTIFFDEKPVKLNPSVAMELGIQTIYQEHNVFDTLSITENIFAGMEIVKHGIMQKKVMYKKTKDVLEYLHSDLNPDELVGNLTSGEKKIVEIAKALVFDCKMIILDEPTASFSANEIDNLLEIVDKIKKRNIGIVYISHHLDEVFRIADYITVLRDGIYIKTVGVDEITEPQLVRDMVGRDASAFYTREYYPAGETVLEVKNLTGNGVRNVSFEVKRGEIVGFAGMVGAGRSELMDLLFGGARKLAGEIRIHGKKVDYRSPSDAIKNKMCYITEDRQHTGLFLSHSIARNTIIANLVKMKGVFVNPAEEMKIGNEYIKTLRTKANDASVEVGNLSGGNQQKVVLAKWFLTNGDIFIFDEPTRGIDVGAKQEIYQIMMNLLKEKKAIIMVSSDTPEVVSMSDRVIVMKEGRVAGILNREEISEENILELSIGGKKI